MTGIAVWVSNVKQKLVSGLTDRTTVQDVMKALNTQIHTETHGIYQECGNSHQLLRPRAKVLQVLQAFEEEDLQCVRFVLRSKDSVCDSNNSSTTSSQHSSYNSEHGCSKASLQQHTIQEYSLSQHSSRTSLPSRGLHHSNGSLQSTGRLNSCASLQTTAQQHSRSSLQLSTASQHNGSSFNPDESGVEKLLRLMREQDTKLTEQMDRIRKIESEIECIETDTHITRIQEDGANYIQQVYMLPKKLSQGITTLEQQILEEQKQISQLSEQVKDANKADPDLLTEIRSLKEAVRDSIHVSMGQETEFSKMNETLKNMQTELDEKAQCITQLVEELDEVEGAANNAEVSEYSMLLQHRLGANHNIVDNIMQRYKSNMKNIEGHFLDESRESNGSDSGVSSQSAGSHEEEHSEEEAHNSTLLHASSEEEIRNPSQGKDSSVLQSPSAPLATYDSTLLPSSKDTTLLAEPASHPARNDVIDLTLNRSSQQISIIQQNLTLTNETLPNDTLQPLDMLVTRERVVTSTPVPAHKPVPRIARVPSPPPPPMRKRVAFSDHDSIREISRYSMEDTTIVEEEEDESEEEDEGNVTQEEVVSHAMPAERFVVNIHPQHVPAAPPSENMSYQNAIYNYSPPDESHTNFLHAGPVSRLHRKLRAAKSSKSKSSDMRQKFMEKLLFLPKLAKNKSKAPSARGTYEDTFDDSYRHALGPRTEMTSSLRHSVSQNDITHTEEVNDVTLLRSYTVGDLGKIGYSWIEDQFTDKHNESLPSGWSCANPSGLETLV